MTSFFALAGSRYSMYNALPTSATSNSKHPEVVWFFGHFAKFRDNLRGEEAIQPLGVQRISVVRGREHFKSFFVVTWVLVDGLKFKRHHCYLTGEVSLQ